MQKIKKALTCPGCIKCNKPPSPQKKETIKKKELVKNKKKIKETANKNSNPPMNDYV